MPRPAVLLALLTSMIVACGASQASALRYAGPNGPDGATCQTVATACSLTTAITGSTTTSEEIVVLPGHYAVSSTITPVASDLHIHGVAGQPRPIITGASGVQVFHGLTLNLADLDIEGSGELLGISGGLFDRVLIRGAANGSVLCQCYDGTIRDSVLVVTAGVGGIGINSNGGSATESLLNDTFISTAAGTPAIRLLQVGSTTPATIAYTARNVIARNLAGGFSVQSSQNVAGQSTVLTLHHSDLGTIAPLANGSSVVATDADLTTAPLFADAAGGDFHVLAGSATIGAGADDPLNGTLDFDSAQRTVATTDMGAFEYQPPAAAPPATTAVDPPVTTTGAIAPPVPRTPPPAAPTLSLRGRAFVLGATASKLPVSALCSSAAAGTCTVTGTLRASVRRHGAAHATTVVVGSLRGALTAGRRGTLTLSLNQATLRTLRPGATGPVTRLAVALSATVSLAGASRTLDARLSISARRPPVKHRKLSRRP